jgi:hypothetical protein
MNALAVTIKPITFGWGIYLTDDRELARFRGPGSKWRALRYLANATKPLRTPDIAKKGARPTGTRC